MNDLKIPESPDIDLVPNPDGPRGELPEIQLPSAGYSITESAQQLFTVIAPSHKLFVRGGLVMTLGEDQMGKTIFLALKPEAARSEFEQFARLVKASAKENELVPALCSTDTAKALLACEQAKKLLPKVTGLINSPVIYEHDGDLVIAGPGYNAGIQKVITGGAMAEEVDLARAKGALLDLVKDFNFQSEGDKSRAVASFIAPALKLGGLLKSRVPADVAEADKSQSGKTYRQKLIAAVYGEQVSAIAARVGGVGSLDESFSKELLDGHAFIQFDNLRGKLNSQLLEAFFSAEGAFQCRVPHGAIATVKATDYFIFVTSNGFETTRDFANRSSIIRIRKQPPRFKFATYPEGDVLAHIQAGQPFYLGCVFSVIRAWHQAGKPRTEEHRHDFREWCQIMDWIVVNLFGLAPLMDGHREAQECVSNPDMVFLRLLAIAVDQGGALNDPQNATQLAEICELESLAIPGCRNGWETDKLARSVGSCFTRALDGKPSIELEAYSISVEMTEKKRDDRKGYYHAKSYVFRRLGEVNKPVPVPVPVQPKPVAKSPHLAFGANTPSLTLQTP